MLVKSQTQLNGGGGGAVSTVFRKDFPDCEPDES